MKLKKKYSLEEISSKYNCKILGDINTTFEYVSSIFNIKDNAITYVTDIKNVSYIENTKLSCVITNSKIDELYIEAINHGALGGKLLGAGGGGFLLLYMKKENSNAKLLMMMYADRIFTEFLSILMHSSY